MFFTLEESCFDHTEMFTGYVSIVLQFSIINYQSISLTSSFGIYVIGGDILCDVFCDVVVCSKSQCLQCAIIFQDFHFSPQFRMKQKSEIQESPIR